MKKQLKVVLSGTDMTILCIEMRIFSFGAGRVFFHKEPHCFCDLHEL